MTQRKRARLHIVVGLGFLCSMVFMSSPTTAKMKTSQSQGSGDMKGMKQMMGECRAHHEKAGKAIDQMMMKMEGGQRSNDATKMRATLEASQKSLAEVKQDMATCMNNDDHDGEGDGRPYG